MCLPLGRLTALGHSANATALGDSYSLDQRETAPRPRLGHSANATTLGDSYSLDQRETTPPSVTAPRLCASLCSVAAVDLHGLIASGNPTSLFNTQKTPTNP